MSIPPIPKEIESLVSLDMWKGPSGKSIIGHRTAIMDHPEKTRQLLESGIFSFSDLLDFEWQEIEVVIIHTDEILQLAALGLKKKDFNLFDAPQLIEIVYHITQLKTLMESGIPPDELVKFSGYQLKLVLEKPEAMASILKNFEGVDNILRLQWNWIEEMLMRPEEALILLEHGVKWHQIDDLPAWDFGWFLAHQNEIIKLMDFGIDFEIIAHLDHQHLKLSPAFAPIIESGLEAGELDRLDFYQLFMILSHRSEFIELIRMGCQKPFLKLDSRIMELLLENLDKMIRLQQSDSSFLEQLKQIRPVKVEILLPLSEGFKQLAEHGAAMAILKILSDEQFQLVLENPDVYTPIVELAEQYELPLATALDIEISIARLMNENPGKLKVLLDIDLTFDDLTRYPLVLPQVIQYAENIVALSDKGIPIEEIFHLSTDQIQYAFSRFPLLDILPELGLSVKDLQLFQIEEFKVILTRLKALSLLKKEGVDLRGLSDIKLPHLEVLLKYPEYVLSLMRKGIPIYKFDHINAHKLDVLLRDPLTPEAQLLIQKLMNM